MISIIVPVYNAHKTLKRCIKSILGQSYSELQLVVVIDGVGGNQDKCLEIVKSIQNRDKRVDVIVQENAGVDRARFAGLDAAKGEFVTFVDADDWLEPDALSSMMAIMNEDNYDYVEVSSYKCLGPVKKKRDLPLSGPIRTPELFDKYYISFFGWNVLPVSIWGKLYRMERIQEAGLSPSGFAMGEDLIFNMKLFPYLKSIYLLNAPYYNYRFGGMTSRYNPHLLKDLKFQFLLKLQAIDRYSYHQAENPARIEMVNVLHSDIKQRIIYQEDQTRHYLIEAIKEEISDDFWTNVLNITNNYLDKSPFYLALQRKDAEALYDICKNEVDSGRISRIGKRIVSSILKLF